jgi:hypothetical protein
MKQSRKEQGEAPAVFMPGDLIAGAAHFGASLELMAGALYGVSEPITREEAETRLEEFRTKTVTTKTVEDGTKGE